MMEYCNSQDTRSPREEERKASADENQRISNTEVPPDSSSDKLCTTTKEKPGFAVEVPSSQVVREDKMIPERNEERTNGRTRESSQPGAIAESPASSAPSTASSEVDEVDLVSVDKTGPMDL